MTKLNEHMLFVLKWLDDPTQFTQEQVRSNADDASYAASAASAVSATTFTTNNAAAYVDDATYWVREYFRRSGENKEDYINAINKET